MSMTRATVTPLTAERRRAHYWKRLVYLGPMQPARCECGRNRRHWTPREGPNTPSVMLFVTHTVRKYSCRCGRPVIKVDPVAEGVNADA